ncbi:hypothetical protein QTP70_009875 [Hemibagrus guttatus]|uniref:ribonuclease H n=1 Tax=Hemibagrus guttatus TaxID=175788 RepID=A0AAE0ULT9_9TELE|nr:hypothetical protein QTP70_009875 [Hemibagrus guttatus]
MKLWERVVEARLRKVVEICEQQYGFMPRKSTTDAIFALRILMEKYRDGQRELHCVFVDLEKAYDRVPREELWYCMRKSGVAEKYVRVVQDMYERSRTVVRCAVGQTEEFKVEVGLHQGSALSPFLFAMVMDQLSEEVKQESPWTMMFADDIVICSESREQVEESLERWRFALEKRGMKVSRSKTEYMCVNEREGSGTVRLQGEEVKKVQEFKYLGSTVQNNGECGKEVKKRVQAGLVSGAAAERLSASELRSWRSSLFSKEQARQRSLYPRVEKIEVTMDAPGLQGTLLVMNKGMSTPYSCARHLTEWHISRAALALVDGEPWHMHRPLTRSCSLTLLTFKDANPQLVNQAYWRSCAALLGQVLDDAFKEEYSVELLKIPEVPEHLPQNATRDTVECLLQVHKTHVDWLGKLPRTLEHPVEGIELVQCSTTMVLLI